MHDDRDHESQHSKADWLPRNASRQAQSNRVSAMMEWSMLVLLNVVAISYNWVLKCG